MNKWKEKNFLKAMLIISIFVFFTGLFVNDYKYSIQLIIVLILILQIKFIIKNRKNNLLFIISIYLMTYYIPLVQFYFQGFKLTNHDNNFINQYDEKTLYLYCLFYIIFYISINLMNKNVRFEFELEIRDNIILFYIAILLICICIVFGHVGEIQIGTYGNGNSGATILNEYIIIFILLAHIYTGKKLFRKNLIFMLIGIYIIINFLYGDRIGVLQVGLLIFFIFFNKNWGYKHILLSAIIATFIFNSVAIFRATGMLKVEKNKMTNYEVIIDNNQSQVFNSSICILKLVDENIISFENRIKSFSNYIARIFIKSKVLELGNLSAYSSKIYNSQGGGFIVLYFYVWFGIFGVIAISLIVSSILSNIINGNYKNSSWLIFIALFPRWLVYDPLIALKMPMYTMILIILFNKFDKFLKKIFYKGRNKNENFIFS